MLAPRVVSIRIPSRAFWPLSYGLVLVSYPFLYLPLPLESFPRAVLSMRPACRR